MVAWGPVTRPHLCFLSLLLLFLLQPLLLHLALLLLLPHLRQHSILLGPLLLVRLLLLPLLLPALLLLLLQPFLQEGTGGAMCRECEHRASPTPFHTTPLLPPSPPALTCRWISFHCCCC